MANFGSFASGSSLALALSMGLAGQAAAQPAPAPEAEETIEITGSFIRGTPEDAAIPVRAITLQEITNIGAPSNLDLVKNMVDSGAVRGEGDRRGAGSSIGVQTINLRQLGSARTLVLLNGRRLQDQSSAGVRFSNIAVVPNNAVGRVDTLRDGGAVTYGSDAIGGVVNYITRHDFNGLQVRTNYRFVEDSDGDYDGDLLWGSADDKGNVLFAGQFQHRSTLDLMDRDWAVKDYLQNNASLAWSASGSPGSYTWLTARNAISGQLQGAVLPSASGVTVTSYSPTNAGLAAGDYLRQMSATGVFRDPGCSALGGFAGWSATPSPICYFSLNKTEKLAEETDTYSAYAEANYEFGGGLRYHGEAIYYLLQAPEVMNTPSEAAASFPVKYVTCASAGVAVGGGALASCTTAGQVVTFAQSAFQVDGRNPAVADLVSKFTSSAGNPSLSLATRNAIMSATGGVSLTSWRPYGVGGNPLTGGNAIQRNRLDQVRMTHQVSGDLPKIFGTDLRWTADVTGIHTVFTVEASDLSVDRLQAALNGFGGPNCPSSVTVPGTGGCQWFNPFSSAVQRNVYTGAVNPDYNAALANSAELNEWLIINDKYERDYTSVEGNFKVDGELPIELAGGPVAVAFGGQYRYSKELFTLGKYSDQNKYGCTTGVNCPWTSGPGYGQRFSAQFGVRQETKRNYPAYAAFAEVQAPIFDTLTADLAVRYEKFISDTGSVNNSVVAPQGSLRWQATDWLALRGVAGSTFANVTPPENNPATISTTNSTVSYGVGGSGFQFTTVNTPNFFVSPERGFNYNVGVILEKGPLQLNVDYYNIRIDNLARTIGVGNVINGIVVPGQPQNASALINCNSSLLSDPVPGLGGQAFVTLNSNYDTLAECMADPTPTIGEAFSNVGGSATVRYFGLPRNINAGEFQTDGIDVQSSLTFDDVLGGRLVLTADGTKVLSFDYGDFTFGGVLIAAGYDGTGNYNSSAAKDPGGLVFEYRTNVGFNYTHGRHNFNWRTQYTSAIDTDIAATLTSTASFASNANIPNTGVNVVDGNAASCAAAPSLTNGPDGVIPGAGAGVFGTLAGGRIGLCNANNVSLTGGSTGLPAIYNSDFTYRLTLPWDTAVTATVQNVFDHEPGYERVASSYDSYLESPTGRTYRIGVQKKF